MQYDGATLILTESVELVFRSAAESFVNHPMPATPSPHASNEIYCEIIGQGLGATSLSTDAWQAVDNTAVSWLLHDCPAECQHPSTAMTE